MKIDYVTSFVTCWRMKLNNGKLLCFTDSDQDILFEDEVYVCGSYFTPNTITSSNELAQDNFKISGIIDGKIIERKSLLDGDFSDSYLEIFLINLLEAPHSKIILKTGWLGEIKCNQYNFTAEIYSLGSKTNNVIGQCYSSSCRVEFADQYCKINKEKYLINGVVTELAEKNSFIDESRKEPDDYFAKGILTFISGVNNGRKYSVSEFRNNKIILDFISDLKITIGDQYKIIAGCDKSIQTCINKFNNAINFRGEPYIPSQHQLIIGN